jgi:hypothetical protein
VDGRDKVWSVNEDKTEITETWQARPESRVKGVGHHKCKLAPDEALCYRTPAPRHSDLVASKVAIFHYVTRSFQDYQLKLERGAGVPFFTRDEGWFERIQRCSPWQVLTS